MFRCLEVQLDSFVEGLLTFNVVFMNLIYTALHLSFGGESFGGGIFLVERRLGTFESKNV